MAWRTKGLAEGLEKGKVAILAELVRDGVLSLSDAAARLGINEDDFRAAADTAIANP